MQLRPKIDYFLHSCVSSIGQVELGRVGSGQDSAVIVLQLTLTFMKTLQSALNTNIEVYLTSDKN